MKPFFVFTAVLLTFVVKSQPTVKVEVSSDTISIGEIVEVTYTIENGEGNFNMPDLSDLPVVSGPNTSSSFSYMNGKKTSSQSYSFGLMGMVEGRMVIPKASYNTKEDVVAIQPIEIMVLPEMDQPAFSKNSTESPGSKKIREKKKF